VILSAVSLLWMYQRVMQGPVAVTGSVRMTDLSSRELLTFVPLIVLIFAIGLYPSPLLSRSEASVRALVARVDQARAQVTEGLGPGAWGVGRSLVPGPRSPRGVR